MLKDLRENTKLMMGKRTTQTTVSGESSGAEMRDLRFLILVVLIILTGSSASILADQQLANPTRATREENLERFLRYVNRMVPIKRLVYQIDSQGFQHNGRQIVGSPVFEASIQTNTFYIRSLFDIVSGRVVTNRSGPVNGLSYSGSWLADQGIKHYSLTTNYHLEPDPIAHELAFQESAALPVFTLGLSPLLEPGSVSLLNSTQINARTRTGKSVPIDVRYDTAGRIKELHFELSGNGFLLRQVILYHYSEGMRPAWLPARVVTETMETGPSVRREGKSTNHILECSLGSVEVGIHGYVPESFVENAKPYSIVYSNGLGYSVKGTNITRVILQESAMHPSTKRSRSVRWAVLALICFATGFFLFTVVKKKYESPNLENDNEQH